MAATSSRGSAWATLCGGLCLAVSAAACASGSADLHQRPIDQGALELEVERVDVPGGPTFLIVPRAGAPTAALAVAYPTGSADDPPGRSGAAHFLEHLLFKGSTSVGTVDFAAEAPLLQRLDLTYDSLRVAPPEARPRWNREFQALQDSAATLSRGADFSTLLANHGAIGLNATTTTDLTTYYVELPANRIEVALILEADRMYNAVFRGFHNEREVVLEERRARIDDSPSGRLYEAHLAAAYPDHPYGRTPVGLPDDLEEITRADVVSFYDRHYAPSNAVVTIVGDVDPGRVRSWIAQYFPARPAHPPSEAFQARPTPTGTRTGAPVRRIVTDGTSPRIRVGWPTVPGDHEDAPALAVVSSLLAGGRTSRLNQRLVTTERTATFVSASLGPGTRYEQLFTVEAVPVDQQSLDAVEAAVVEEVERLAREPVDERELGRLRRQLAASEIRRLRSNLGLALELSGEQALRKDWRGAVEFTRRMATVTPAEVQDVVRRHLAGGPGSVAVLVADGPVPSARTGAAAERSARPPPGVTESPRRLETAATESGPTARERVIAYRAPPLRLRPPRTSQRRIAGATVLLVEDHELPLVDVVFHFRGGPSFFPRERMGVAAALPAMIRSGGTVSMSPDSVDSLIEGWAFEAAFGGGGQSVVSSLGVLTRDLGFALEVWGELLSSPDFNADALERWRLRERESLRRQRENPVTSAYTRFNELMFADHPVGWSLSELDVSPTRVTREALQSYHRDVVCRQNLVVGLSGNTTWERVAPMLERLINRLPDCDTELGRPPAATVRRASGVFLLPKPGAAQSTIVLGVGTGVQQEDSPEYFASQVANTILGASGMSSRLFVRLRNDEGLAYSASSVWTTPPYGDGVFASVTQTRSDRTLDAVRIVLDELKAFRDEGPTQAEVDHTVRELVNGYAFAFRDARAVVLRRLSFLRMGLPDDWLERRTYQIGQVRRRDIVNTLQRHVDPADFTILIVGDPAAFDLSELGPYVVLEP